jgi:phospholipid/cholesterol/gamma-HCH transport system substrate-binding protein
MRFKNETLVGLAIVLAVAVAVLGARYLGGLPVFGGAYPLVAVFDDAQGLAPGSAVRVSGVRVGRVGRVRLSPSAQHVIVDMEIDGAVQIPRGARLSTGGFSALGDVSIAITPGPVGNPPLAPGDTLLAATSRDLFGLLQDNADRLFGQADTLLTAAAGTFTSADRLLDDTQGDLRQTLAALRGTTTTVDQIVRAERARLASTLRNLEAASAGAASLTADLQRFSDTHADSVALAITALNQTLGRADVALAQLDATTVHLDEILVKLNAGQGTLGLLLNEPDLYHQLDATLTSLNDILADFQADPARYLRELRLIRIF